MPSEEEVRRRSLVVAARKAGTSIRKKMIERQALSADINLPVAKKTKERIDECLQPLPKPKNIPEKGPGEVLSGAMDTFLGSQNWVLEAKDCVDQANKLIEVGNKILSEIGDEGIYAMSLSSVPWPSDTNNCRMIRYSLDKARERMKDVIEFFEALAEHKPQA